MAASEEGPEPPTEPLDIACGLENVPVSVWPPGAVPEPFQYTPEHVAGPGADADPAEITFPGCLCLHRPCVPGSCSCLRHVENYDADARLRALGSAAGCAPPVFECNALCPCPERCANRVVQRGVQLRLQVFRTRRKGWGLRTLESIPRGRFVCEYAGEVLGLVEARRRIRLQTPRDANYIIAVREHVCSGPVMETFVDPARVGNVGRFLNHSCEPNLLMVPVRVDSMVPRLALFAAKDILPEEELSYDYSGRFLNRMDGEDRGRPADGKLRKPCYCGSGVCLAFLPYDGSLYLAPEPPGEGPGGRAQETRSCTPPGQEGVMGAGGSEGEAGVWGAAPAVPSR
ncbi:histone-lysine N-methyltransferase SETMAR [Phyllostomus hastatus]|uniref:histone-lysine N-methyltransferase SETMAR n=1 Tax=Phyllostomus hastatus TaxID=9423 RepID=UPI001E67E0FA|nr:histone-lysine N-methyltransferase SETMAR [Phyllostomus hastatus]